MKDRYPELRTRLVFHPLWLRETRFGEILYKADVLLKELSVGATVLNSDEKLRAAQVNGYIPSDERSAVTGLLQSDQSGHSGVRGYRLWFDLLPVNGDAASAKIGDTNMAFNHDTNLTIYENLKEKGYINFVAPTATLQSALYSSGDMIDLSQVFPKMFVRRHDIATGEDLPGSDRDLDILSAHLNGNAEKYANAYQELRDLINVFRAYVVAVKVVKLDAHVCVSVHKMPLVEAEKTATALPETRPSELFFTVATYVQSGRRERRTLHSSRWSVSGGISLRGKAFYAAGAVNKETPLIQEMQSQIARADTQRNWKSQSGRQYVALNIDTRDPPRRCPLCDQSAAVNLVFARLRCVLPAEPKHITAEF